MSFIKKAVKAVVGAVTGVVKTIVKAVGSVVSAVINFVASPFMGLFGMPDPSAAGEAQRQQGILVQREGSNVDLPVVYGYRKLAGTVVYAETGSTNNKYLWVAYVFAEGAVEGLRELWVDDNLMPTDTTGRLNQGTVTEITDSKNKYYGRVKFQWYPGVYYNNAGSTGIGTNSILAEAPSWKNTMSYNGLAVLFARYEWKEIKTQADSDNNPFGGGIPQIQISVLGRKVASLLSGSGQENYEYGASGYAERYSTNPAEILLDYLRNPRYGKGMKNSEIDFASFRSAALKCNQVVTYVSGITGPILTTNYVLDTGQTIFNNVKQLLTNMRGYMPYVQGRYKLKIEDAGSDTDITSGVATIVKTFDKDNIVGDITYTGIERSAKYNQVVVSYVDPDQKFSVQQVVWPETETERQIYIARDGNRENKAELTFPGCTNYAIAKDFARLIFNKSRWQDSCSFTGDSSCFELEPGDNVYIAGTLLNFGTNPALGAIPWRIVSIQLNTDYTFNIGCVRNPDFIYPHTRVNEIDIVLPPYVPKGADIYYPGTGRVLPEGLVPPTNGVQPGDPGSNPGSNPPPSDPTDITVLATAIGTGSISAKTMTITAMTSGTYQVGMALTGVGVSVGTTIESQVSGTTGGVGVYTVSISQTVTSTTLTGRLYTGSTGGGVGDPDSPINTDPINNPSPEPVPVQLANDVVTIDNVKYRVEGNYIYADLTFKQPNHVMYSSLGVWFKRSTPAETVYKELEIKDRPGAGKNVTFTIGPLIKDYYKLYHRVTYSTGDSSTVIGNLQLDANGVILTEDPKDFNETVGAGWTLPTSATPNSKSNYLSSIVGTPLLTTGNPRNPREMTITVKQDIQNEPINGYIAGMNIYYKTTANKYWKTAQVNFDQTYAEGSSYTFSLPFTLGATGTVATYDWVLRFRYADGSESQYQYRNMGVNVNNNPAGAFSYNPFSLVVGKFKELVSDYVLTTEDNAPGASDPREIKFAWANISNSVSTANRIYFTFKQISASDKSSLVGARVRFKEILATATSTTTTDFAVPFSSDALGEYLLLTVNNDSMYEYVITPRVSYNGSTVEANYSWYISGYIHNRSADPDYPRNGNWLEQFSKEQLATATAIAKIGTATAAAPNRNTVMTSMTWTELLTGGLPRTPREMSLTLVQTTPPTNAALTGLKIYYKPTTFGYWYEVKHTFSSYTQGSSYTFTLPCDLGTPQAVPSILNSYYDFIIRFTYSDGSESLKQFRKMSVIVQGGSNTTAFQLENSTAYPLITVDNAPPGTVTDPRELTISVNEAYQLNGLDGKSIVWILNTPSDPLRRWVGVRLYYREVVAGTNPAFTAVDFFPVGRDNLSNLFIKQQIVFGKEYEYVLVPVVIYNATKTECNLAWYGRGAIDANLTQTGAFPKWWQLLNFKLINTQQALQQIRTVFPQTDPTVQVTSFKLIRTTSAQTQFGSPRDRYYQIQYYHQHIGNFNEVDIYRRSNPGSGGYTYTPLYIGTGRWEKMTVTSTNTSPNGVVTVNLRPPIQSTEFNAYFTGSPPGSGSNALVSTLYTTNKPCGTSPVDEFLIVAKANSTLSPKAILLTTAFVNVSTISGLETQFIGNYRPQTVTVADYNTQVAGWLRRLTDARASVSSTVLLVNGAGAAGVTLPTTSPSII